MRKWLIGFFAMACLGCHAPATTQTEATAIHLSKDSQTVYISGLDYSVLQEMRKDSLSLENWQGIFPVYKIPTDTDMADLQPEQPGTYTIADSTLVFKPDTVFSKHQQYLVCFYGNGTNFSSSNLVRSKTNLKGQSFIEKVFKF